MKMMVLSGRIQYLKIRNALHAIEELYWTSVRTNRKESIIRAYEAGLRSSGGTCNYVKEIGCVIAFN